MTSWNLLLEAVGAKWSSPSDVRQVELKSMKIVHIDHNAVRGHRVPTAFYVESSFTVFTAIFSMHDKVLNLHSFSSTLKAARHVNLFPISSLQAVTY